MKFEVFDRVTGAVKFVADIHCDHEAPKGVKLAHAIKWAYSHNVDMTRTDLAGAFLKHHVISGANLSDCDLTNAILRDVDATGTRAVPALFESSGLPNQFVL
jgi:hypothetical protein